MGFEILYAENHNQKTGKRFHFDTMALLSDFVRDARKDLTDIDKNGPIIYCPTVNSDGEITNGRKGAPMPRNWMAIDIDGPKEIDPETGKAKVVIDETGKKTTAPSQGISNTTLDKIKAYLAPYEGFMHPTYSDKPQAPNGRGRKYHVFLALSESLDEKAWKQCANGVIKELENAVPELKASERWTPSIDLAGARPTQGMYTTPKKHALKHELLKGVPINVKMLLSKARSKFTTSPKKAQQSTNKIGVVQSIGEGAQKAKKLVLDRLNALGLYMQDAGGGKHIIRCPFGDHEQGSNTSTVYYEPGTRNDQGTVYEYGGFSCLHETCHGRTFSDFLSQIEIDPDEYRSLIKEANGEIHYGGLTMLEEYEGREGVYLKTDDPKTGAVFVNRECDPIDVTALTKQDNDEINTGFRVEFTNIFGAEIKRTFYAVDFEAPQKMRSELRKLGLGLEKPKRPNQIDVVANYLAYRAGHTHRVLTEPVRVGWQGNDETYRAYAMVNTVFGPDKDKYLPFEKGEKSMLAHSVGTLEGWRKQVAAPCVASKRIMLAVLMALAFPMIRLVNRSCFGVLFLSQNSKGKTTSLQVAKSLMGTASVEKLTSFNATTNGLETFAAAHNDGAIILDEIGQSTVKDFQALIYMLFNSVGKLRANADLTLRGVNTWLAGVLSTGNQNIAKMVRRSGNRSPDPALYVRLLEIPSVISELGIYETMPVNPSTGKPFKDINTDFLPYLAKAMAQNHGVAYPVWIEFLAEFAKEPDSLARLTDKVTEYINAFANAVAIDGEDTAFKRVAGHFGLAYAAGILSTSIGSEGLTGWTEEQIFDAVKTCYESWRENYGSSLGKAVDNLKAKIQEVLTDTNTPIPSEIDYVMGHRGAWGFWRFEDGYQVIYIKPDRFNRDIADGNRKEALELLERAGWYKKPEDGHLSVKVRIGGAVPRFYRIINKDVSEDKEYNPADTESV